MSPISKTRALSKISGPPGLPLLGNLLDLDLKDPLQSLIAIGHEYAPIFVVELGGSKEIMICSQRLLDELCDESRFHKIVTGGVEKLRPLGGDGLFTAQHDSHSWEVAHRVLMPLFGPLKIRDMFVDMLDISEQLCLKWARLGPSATIDAAKDFTRLTLDTIALCTMGYRFNSFYSNEKMHPFVESMTAALIDADKQSILPDLIGSCRVRSLAKFRKHVSSMRALCLELIQDRRQNPVEGTDLLNAMMNGKDPKTGAKMTDESIIQNLITFLIAGHETTSGLLSFVFYYLLENPEELRKAREEVDALVGNENLTVDHLNKMPRIDMIMRETLRLMPTAPGFHVTPFKDEIIDNQYSVSAGDVLFVFLHLVHRDPQVWGDDAEEFRPERMADHAFEKLPKNAWKPFGNGMRGCIGRAFAWQEAQLTIAIILQNFDLFKADPTYKLKIIQSLTIKPDDFKIRVKLREGKKPFSMFKSRNDSESPVPNNKHSALRSKVAGSKPISIFFGSNTGTCEALAHRLSADCATYGFAPPTPLPLDSATKSLSKDVPVIIIAASYDGRPSDNATEFAKWVEGLKSGELEGIQYAVFGCGHKDWAHTLFKIPKVLDRCLAGAGAERLVDLGTTDASTGLLYSDFDQWISQQLLPKLVQRYELPSPETRFQADLDLDVTMEERKSMSLRSGFASAGVVKNELLTSPGAPEKHRLYLKLPEDMVYNAGDHLQVLPVNSSELVDQVMKLFGINADTTLTISSKRPTYLPTKAPILATDLFGSLVELSQTISQKNLEQLAEYTADDDTKSRLHALASDGYHDQIHANCTSLMEVLQQHPSIKLPLPHFLSMLPQMRPRTYSFASAPGWEPGHGTLIFSVVSPRQATEAGGRCPGGLATGFMARLKPGDSIAVARRPCRPELNAPIISPMSQRPVIMIAVGAGLAPFHGMLQQRFMDTERQGRTDLAPWVLFFGCRGAQLDDICRDSLDQYERSGVVSVHRAYSQDVHTGCRYVQDSITRHSETLASLWAQEAVIMICSGKKVSDSVLEVLRPILLAEDARHGRANSGNKQAWLESVPRDRLVLEVFN